MNQSGHEKSDFDVWGQKAPPKFWHLDFMWGFEGVTHEKDGGGVQFNGEMADLEATYLVGKVKAKVHPFVEYFKSCKTARNMVY